MKLPNRETVSEQAYNIIKEAIFSGEMAPGQRIVEDALVANMGISRTPLREALHRCEQDGLLSRQGKRGLFVSEISAKEAMELYDIRSYLEGLATRTVTENLTDRQAEILRSIQDKAAYYLEIDAIKEARLTLREIHPFIISCCTHTLCIEYLQRMKDRIRRYGSVSTAKSKRPEQSMQEHIHIIECMLARDADAAELAMREHIQNSYSGFAPDAFKRTAQKDIDSLTD